MNLSIATRLVGVLTVATLCTAGLARAAEPAAPRIAYASMGAPATIAPSAASDTAPLLPAACTGQAWPHLDPACLTAAEGTPTRRAVRTIGLGR